MLLVPCHMLEGPAPTWRVHTYNLLLVGKERGFVCMLTFSGTSYLFIYLFIYLFGHAVRLVGS